MGKSLENRTYVSERKPTKKNIGKDLVKEYDNITGRKLIGRIRDEIYFQKDEKYLQYKGNAIKSYGNIYYGDDKLPFARIEADMRGGSYKFTLFVRSSKLSSPEVKRLNILSIEVKGGSIFSKKRARGSIFSKRR